jgi:hypothetical protein
MPPHEEIHKLNETSHGKVVAEELRTMWLKERWRYEEETTGHRTTKIDDYTPIKFAEMGLSYKEWTTEGKDLIANRDHRWDIEKIELPALQAIDEGKGRYASFEDGSVRSTYATIRDYFGDENVSPFSNKWFLPTNDQNTMSQWRSLLSKTKSEVQRNATDLASVVYTNRFVASDEIKLQGGTDADVAKWKSSELYKAMESLETALANWGGELGQYAFPDPKALKDDNKALEKLKTAAEACNKAFFDVYRAHLPVYDQAGTVPFIKYELLALMRSLAEKVASQLAGRLGRPSFTAMYERICDVPKRESSEEGERVATVLTVNPKYEDQPGSVWNTQMEGASASLKKVNQAAHAELMSAFQALSKKKPPVMISESLNAWSTGYKGGALDLAGMHQAVGAFAFGLQKYKEAVDKVLTKDQYKTDKKILEVQRVYHVNFEGFAWQMLEEVALCKEIS